MKSPDICSIPHCKKPTYVTLENKAYCEDHFNAITEKRKKDFEEAMNDE